MERPADRYRASPVLALVLIALPGWLVVAGVTASLWLYDETNWSAVPFLVGTGVAIAILKVGETVIPEGPRPDQKGRLAWFSDVAAPMRVLRAYLCSCAEAAGVRRWPVVTLTWAAWWLAVGLSAFLVLNAIVQLALGSG